MLFSAAVALLVTAASAQHGPPGEGNSSHHHHHGDDPFAGSGCNCTAFCGPRLSTCLSASPRDPPQSACAGLTHRAPARSQRVLHQCHWQRYHHAVPHDAVRRGRYAEQEHVSRPLQSFRRDRAARPLLMLLLLLPREASPSETFSACAPVATWVAIRRLSSPAARPRTSAAKTLQTSCASAGSHSSQATIRIPPTSCLSGRSMSMATGGPTSSATHSTRRNLSVGGSAPTECSEAG